MGFTIYTVSLSGYVHSRCFEELSLGLAAGLRELGHSAKETGDLRELEGRAIILGAHLLPPSAANRIPENAIIYNTEVVGPDVPWLTPAYLDLLRKHTVWDYSQQNIEAWKAYGINAVYCGIGYHECLARIEPAAEQDIDVLFYGSMNERRAKILSELHAAGINVVVVPFGTYGRERDAYIARAKIVLNIHFYEDAPLEMVRLSYLWANRKCVVLDMTDGPVFKYENFYSAPLHSSIVCRDLLKNPEDRKVLAEYNFRNFSANRQSSYLKAALEETEQAESQRPSSASPEFHHTQLVCGE